MLDPGVRHPPGGLAPIWLPSPAPRRPSPGPVGCPLPVCSGGPLSGGSPAPATPGKDPGPPLSDSLASSSPDRLAWTLRSGPRSAVVVVGFTPPASHLPRALCRDWGWPGALQGVNLLLSAGPAPSGEAGETPLEGGVNIPSPLCNHEITMQLSLGTGALQTNTSSPSDVGPWPRATVCQPCGHPSKRTSPGWVCPEGRMRVCLGPGPALVSLERDPVEPWSDLGRAC